MKKIFEDVVIEIIDVKEDVILSSGGYGIQIPGLQEDDGFFPGN